MASDTTKTPNDQSPNGRNGRRYSPIGKCQSGCNDKNECCPHHCGKAGCKIKYISETSRHFALGRCAGPRRVAGHSSRACQGQRVLRFDMLSKSGWSRCPTGLPLSMPPMTSVVALLYVSTICFGGALLFTAIDNLEPDRRVALVLKCAILATGGAAIANQLLP